MKTPISFLDVESVLCLYKDSVAQFGGLYGIRDRGLLESAIAQPQLTLFGEYAHSDIFHMAAAYCFHLIRNHPFIDGNKRAGLLAALVFLQKNGIRIEVDHDVLYTFTLDIAQSRVTKEQIAVFFKNNSRLLSDDY